MPGEGLRAVRKVLLRCLAVPCLMACVYVGFLSVVSIWIGLGNPDRAGFWVPVLAGFITLLVDLWALLTIIGLLAHPGKKEDLLFV